jgi:hypothetical protein
VALVRRAAALQIFLGGPCAERLGGVRGVPSRRPRRGARGARAARFRPAAAAALTRASSRCCGTPYFYLYSRRILPQIFTEEAL